MPAPTPAADKTETHIRCRICREWKWRSAYRPRHGTCYACEREQNNRRYAKLSGDKLNALIERQAVNHRRRSQAACRKRTENCKWMIAELKRRGLTLTAIAKGSGISRCGLSRIQNHDQKYLHRSVERRLDAFLRELTDA